jgi:hypothetical protein
MTKPFPYSHQAQPWWDNNFMFVGEDGTRKNALDDLCGIIDKSPRSVEIVCLSGFRGIGKTSVIMMAAWFNRTPKPIQKMLSTKNSCKRLLDEIESESKSSTSIRPIIIIIQIDDRLCNNDAAVLKKRLRDLINKINTMSSLSQKRVVIVFESEKCLPPLYFYRRDRDRSTTPAPQDSTTEQNSNILLLDVPPLTDSEVKHLIVGNGKRYKFKFSNSSVIESEDWGYIPPMPGQREKSRMVVLMEEWAGCHPYAVHRLCGKIYSTIDTTGQPFESLVTNDFLDSFHFHLLKADRCRTIRAINNIVSHCSVANNYKLLQDAGLLWSDGKPVKLFRLAFGEEKHIIFTLNGGNEMEPNFISMAGLQIAYWLWYTGVQPVMVRAGVKIGDALGDMLQERIYKIFGKTPPTTPNNGVDESPSKLKELETEASEKFNADLNDANQMLIDIKMKLATLLSDQNKYGMDDLERFWHSCVDTSSIDVLIRQHSAGNPQQGIAATLVDKCVRLNKFHDLIREMRLPTG